MNKMKRNTKSILILILVFISFKSNAQTFEPAPGNNGTTAIKKDSSIIVGWANGIKLKRGLMNISNPSAGYVSFGTDLNAISPFEINTFEVVSLGDSGVAIVTFDRVIENGFGPDFTVFENSFSDGFLEFAFVEVSSDGVNYHRFPSASQAPIINQFGPFYQSNDCRYYNNLAGKYRGGFGTPFDLEELSGINGLDISKITHVKLIDVIGSIDPNFGSFDSQGKLINDLFPTEFPSGGFDLDAVGVIHQGPLRLEELDLSYSIYPNPAKANLTININQPSQLRVLDVIGNEILIKDIEGNEVLYVSEFNSPILFIELSNKDLFKVEKIILLK
jgi:hypothetical protein